MPAPAVLTSDQLSAMWNLMRMERRRRYDASIRTQVEPRDAVHARALAAPILAREARRSCPESSALSDLNRVVALQRKDRDGPTIDAHETQRRDVVQNRLLLARGKALFCRVMQRALNRNCSCKIVNSRCKYAIALLL
jgi:hypothetical protein